MATKKASPPSERCEWCGTDEKSEYVRYHDKEWGVPLHNDRKLFEFLILEGAQAGLSWSTILNKRKHYRKVYDNFKPEVVATYGKRKVNALLKDSGIVRNRLKVESSILNAKLFLEVKKEFGTFDRYIWSFVDGKPKQNKFKSLKDIPATTPISDAMSKDLKKRGFKFIGSTICYAFMQATGMVNDHTTKCYRYKEVKASTPTLSS